MTGAEPPAPGAAAGGPVVAAVDGSDSSYAAARWATGEAGCRQVPLLLVAAVPWTTFLPVGLPHLGEEYGRDAMIRHAERCLEQAAGPARRTLGPERVGSEVRGGSAAEVLWEVSGTAGLLVLGSRGRGGFATLLAGSVAVAAAATAQCPVVVHRAPGDPGGPVVVGVHDVTGPALGFAVEHALAHRAPLVAVHAWFDHDMDPYTAELLARDGRQAAALDAAADRVRTALAPWRSRYPELDARERVLLDNPAGALVGESPRARLVVVGTHGRGALSGALLGSTGQAVLRHAGCPVAVVGAPGIR